MIVEYIRYQLPPGGGPAFEAAYAEAAEVLSASPYCVDYELTRRSQEETAPGAAAADDDEHYILRIRWTSREDHLSGFRRSPEFGVFFAAIRPYFSAIEEMRHYTETSVMGTGSGTFRAG